MMYVKPKNKFKNHSLSWNVRLKWKSNCKTKFMNYNFAYIHKMDSIEPILCKILLGIWLLSAKCIFYSRKVHFCFYIYLVSLTISFSGMFTNASIFSPFKYLIPFSNAIPIWISGCCITVAAISPDSIAARASSVASTP